MGSLWVALGAALLHLGANLLEDAPVRLAYLALSGACLTMAAFVTYGLAGHLRHVHRRSEPGSESDSEGGDEAAPAAWHFFQPFKGGGWFVATQALGWALYSAGLSLIIYLMAHSAIGIVHSAQRFAQTAGIFMVFSHLVRLKEVDEREGGCKMEFWTRIVEEDPSQSWDKHTPFRHLCTSRIAPSHR